MKLYKTEAPQFLFKLKVMAVFFSINNSKWIMALTRIECQWSNYNVKLVYHISEILPASKTIYEKSIDRKACYFTTATTTLGRTVAAVLNFENSQFKFIYAHILIQCGKWRSQRTGLPVKSAIPWMFMQQKLIIHNYGQSISRLLSPKGECTSCLTSCRTT